MSQIEESIQNSDLLGDGGEPCHEVQPVLAQGDTVDESHKTVTTQDANGLDDPDARGWPMRKRVYHT